MNNWDQMDPMISLQMIPRKPAASYWCRLKLVSKAKNNTRHSFMLPEQWDDVEVYVPDENKNYTKFITGSNLSDDQKTVPGMFNIFRLYAHYGDSLTIYINFKSNRLFPYSSTGFFASVSLSCFTRLNKKEPHSPRNISVENFFSLFIVPHSSVKNLAA